MRRLRRLDGLGETYVDTTAGDTTPVRPYRPPQPVVYVPPPTTPPNGPLGPGPVQFVAVAAAAPGVTVTRTPSPTDEAMTAELRIKATRALQLQREPVSPYDPEASYRQYQSERAARWDEYERRVAALPWRGSKPRQGAHPVDVVRALRRRHYAGSPDAEDAARGFVWRMEREDEQYLTRQKQAWTEHVTKMKATALTQKQMPISLPSVRPASDTRDKLAALRQAAGKIDWGAAWMADALVQKIADEMKISPAQATDIVYAAAAKDAMWLLRQATGMQDISGRVATDIKAGGGEIGTALKAGLDAIKNFLSAPKSVAPKAAEGAASLEKQAWDIIAPVAGGFAGKAATLNFAAKFDKYIKGRVPDDPAKARGWANKAYSDLIAFAMKGSPKNETADLIKNEVTARWESRLRRDISEAARTDVPASQDHVDAARRVQEDLRLMRQDIEETAARVTASAIRGESVAAMHRAPESIERVVTKSEAPAPALSKREEQKIRAQLNREGWLPDAIEVYIAQVKGGRP